MNLIEMKQSQEVTKIIKELTLSDYMDNMKNLLPIFLEHGALMTNTIEYVIL